MVAAGLAAVLAAVVWWVATPTVGNFGRAHPASPSAPATRAGPSSSGTPTTAATPTPEGDSTLPGEPTLLTIPTQRIQAPVDPVEAHAGVLDVPPDIHHVGWWTGSALAGASEGTTVIDGHVDSAVAGEGALFRLQDLREGDPLRVDTASRQIRYTVIGRRVISKAGPLPADLFTLTGPPRLVVISCGGPFDRATRSYVDNIVVIAVPVP